MRITIPYGIQYTEIELSGVVPIEIRRAQQSPVLIDPMAALRHSLEAPRDFPALRLALTPGDHIAVAVDRFFAGHREFWLPVLEHITSAGVRPASMAVVLPHDGRNDDNIELQAPWQEIQVIKHDPLNRKRLSYLATTRAGRRVYLNRTVVDADQLIALAKCEYGPRGPQGAEDAIFPALSDAETIAELNRSKLGARGHKHGGGHASKEVTWLLGAPFLIQAIEGSGAGLCSFIAGAADSVPHAMDMLANQWHVELDSPGDVIITSIVGEARNGFLDLAKALANARKATKPGGRIVLLADGSPALGPAMQLLSDAGDLTVAGQRLDDEAFDVSDYEDARQWCQAVEPGSVYLFSGLADDVAESLFVTPLSRLEELKRLVQPDDQVVILPEGNKCDVAIAQHGKLRRSTKPHPMPDS
jgi:hypothetical protein